MSEQSTEQPRSQQTTPAATQRPQASGCQPNRNLQPPQYQIVTEGYNPNPRADIARKSHIPKSLKTST
jgi:hypothetical protein